MKSEKKKLPFLSRSSYDRHPMQIQIIHFPRPSQEFVYTPLGDFQNRSRQVPAIWVVKQARDHLLYAELGPPDPIFGVPEL